MPNKRYNVVEVTSGPKSGRIAVVPCRKYPHKLALRGAKYRLCNVEFLFADGFACGLITERAPHLERLRKVSALDEAGNEMLGYPR